MRNVISVVAFIIIFVAFNLAYLKYGEKFFDLFRLSGENSVYDFQSSSIEDSVDWLGRMCRDGVCLDKTDWRCGFELGDDGDMSQCFIDVSHSAKSWVKLDKIRKYCGKKYAIFSGRYGTKSECKEIGGDWGRIKYVPKIPQ